MSDLYGQAKAAAIDMIRVYVLRGDSYQSLKSSWMGAANASYWGQIGCVGAPHCKPRGGADAVTITRLGGHEVCFEFSLRALYDEIRGVGQLRLFDAA